MLIGLTQLEKKLLESGLVSMPMEEKNDLVTIIAKKMGLSYFEVDENYILDYHKNLKAEEYSVLSDETIVGGFTSTNGHIYRTNRDDQMNMIGKALQLTLDSTLTTVNWKTEDAGYISLDRDAWIEEVFKEGLAHKERTLYKYNTLKYQVALAKTEVELLAIKWDTGA